MKEEYREAIEEFHIEVLGAVTSFAANHLGGPTCAPTELYLGGKQKDILSELFELGWIPFKVSDFPPKHEYCGMTVHFVEEHDYLQVGVRNEG